MSDTSGKRDCITPPGKLHGPTEAPAEGEGTLERMVGEEAMGTS